MAVLASVVTFILFVENCTMPWLNCESVRKLLTSGHVKYNYVGLLATIACFSARGSAHVDITLPAEPAEWIASAACINKRAGLSVANPVSLTAFKPLDVSLNQPVTAIRDEIVPVNVNVKNYLNGCLAVSNIFLVCCPIALVARSIRKVMIAVQRHQTIVVVFRQSLFNNRFVSKLQTTFTT